MEKNIMQYQSVLPKDFDGTFRFTNWSDEEFVGKWGGKEYHFSPKSTSPIIIHDQTPLEIQQIRKKFAKDLAEREFGKSPEMKRILSYEKNHDGTPNRLNSFQGAVAYTIDDLAPYIQRCLEPLPIAQVIVTETPVKQMEDNLSRNEDGEINTKVVTQKISLKKRALEGDGL